MSNVWWYRVDSDARVNPKIGQLTDSETRALLLGVWSYCASRRNGGLFDTSELPAMVYLTPRGPRSVTAAHITRFKTLGLLDCVLVDARPRLDCFMVHDWLIHNGETVAQKVGAWLTKFPHSSANETHRALGGKRETVLAEHAKVIAQAVPRNHNGTEREPPQAVPPPVPLVCVSEDRTEEPKNLTNHPPLPKEPARQVERVDDLTIGTLDPYALLATKFTYDPPEEPT